MGRGSDETQGKSKARRENPIRKRGRSPHRTNSGTGSPDPPDPLYEDLLARQNAHGPWPTGNRWKTKMFVDRIMGLLLCLRVIPWMNRIGGGSVIPGLDAGEVLKIAFVDFFQAPRPPSANPERPPPTGGESTEKTGAA